MENRPFIDKNRKPAGEKLKEALACVYSYYADLLKFTNVYKHDWGFSKSGGWIEKAHDATKALYYLTPLEGAFKISLAIRESEKELMINDGELNKYHSLIKEAKQYSEGYKLQFVIEDEMSYNYYKKFLKKLIALR